MVDVATIPLPECVVKKMLAIEFDMWHDGVMRWFQRTAPQGICGLGESEMPITHTPGPWIARRGTIGTTQYHIAEMMPSSADDMWPGFAPAEQQEANARLIAAAPDLLAALSTLDSIERGMQGWHEDAKAEAWAKARAALARAKGEA